MTRDKMIAYLHRQKVGSKYELGWLNDRQLRSFVKFVRKQGAV